MPSGNLKSVNRRSILKTASALTVPTFLPKNVFGANEKKINIAWVGFGNMGWGDLNNCANGNNVVALCDCNPGTWERAKKKYPKAKFYKDFRKKSGILIGSDGNPIGGKWSFDEDNRNKLPKNISIPKFPKINETSHTKKLKPIIEKEFKNHPGLSLIHI